MPSACEAVLQSVRNVSTVNSNTSDLVLVLRKRPLAFFFKTPPKNSLPTHQAFCRVTRFLFCFSIGLVKIKLLNKRRKKPVANCSCPIRMATSHPFYWYPWTGLCITTISEMAFKYNCRSTNSLPKLGVLRHT